MRHDTVFSPSFGNRPSYLVGREKIIAEFMQGLASNVGNRDRATVLLGQAVAARRSCCGSLPTARVSKVL